MVSKASILIIFGALVITLVFVLYLTLIAPVPEVARTHTQARTPTPMPTVEEQPTNTPAPEPTQTPLSTPVPGGNIDEAVGAIMSEPAGEALIFKEGEQDTNEITSDSKVLKDLSQAYDESQF